MKDTIINYLELIKSKEKLTKEEKEDLKTNIEFFQHERLVHLLVTIFTGISTIMFFSLSLREESLPFLLLSLITLVLFFFYILHYYFLENSIQKLYDYYNKKK